MERLLAIISGSKGKGKPFIHHICIEWVGKTEIRIYSDDHLPMIRDVWKDKTHDLNVLFNRYYRTWYDGIKLYYVTSMIINE